MEEITNAVQAYISTGYLLALVFFAYALRSIVGDIVGVIPAFKKKQRTYAVLFIAAAIFPVWYFAFHEDAMKLIVTYGIGTSLYETIIQAIVAKFKPASAPPFKEEA